MKKLLSVLLLLGIASCGKDTSYVYPYKGTQNVVYSEEHAVVSDEAKVDILWVIDNSGSMDPIQAEIKANADMFMEEFIKKGLNWRMGLISTSEYEEPYLGLKTIFDHTGLDAVKTFNEAVTKLGTSGDPTEKTYEPLIKYLKKYPAFLRDKTHLIVIMVSDEAEQSDITSATFMSEMIKLKINPKLFKAYGAFKANDFGCTGTTINYSTSKFKEVIDATSGKMFPTCTPDFGLKLADLSKDIIDTVMSPVILLTARPITKTIKVNYGGLDLPGGSQESGGLWLYDPESNGIRFHDLDFVNYDIKNVKVTFDVDQ